MTVTEVMQKSLNLEARIGKIWFANGGLVSVLEVLGLHSLLHAAKYPVLLVESWHVLRGRS